MKAQICPKCGWASKYEPSGNIALDSLYEVLFTCDKCEYDFSSDGYEYPIPIEIIDWEEELM